MGVGKSKKDARGRPLEQQQQHHTNYPSNLPMIPVQLQQQQPQPLPPQQYMTNSYGQMMPLPQPVINALQPLDMNALSQCSNMNWQQPFQPQHQQPMPMQFQQQTPLFYQPPPPPPPPLLLQQPQSMHHMYPPYEQSMTSQQLSVPKMACERDPNVTTLSSMYMPPTQPIQTQSRMRVVNYLPTPRTN
jgi:hypothetical protein